MLIDTIAQTVRFNEGEVLDLDGLWALVSLLEIDAPEPTGSITITPIPAGYVRESDIVGIVEVASQTSRYLYSVVVFADESYACSCKDWIYRRSVMPFNSPCKHILRVHLHRTSVF